MHTIGSLPAKSGTEVLYNKLTWNTITTGEDGKRSSKLHKTFKTQVIRKKTAFFRRELNLTTGTNGKQLIPMDLRLRGHGLP